MGLQQTKDSLISISQSVDSAWLAKQIDWCCQKSNII